MVFAPVPTTSHVLLREMEGSAHPAHEPKSKYQKKTLVGEDRNNKTSACTAQKIQDDRPYSDPGWYNTSCAGGH